MHPSEDFELDRELPPESDGLVEDLDLSTLFEAMARGDKFLLAVGKAAVLSPAGRAERDRLPPGGPHRLPRPPGVRETALLVGH